MREVKEGGSNKNRVGDDEVRIGVSDIVEGEGDAM